MADAPICTGQFADAETCPIHGPEIRDARNRARAYHNVVLQHRDPLDEEVLPHAFNSRTHYEPADDRDIWCRDCEYHRDHAIHGQTTQPDTLRETVLEVLAQYGIHPAAWHSQDGNKFMDDLLAAVR